MTRVSLILLSLDFARFFFSSFSLSLSLCAAIASRKCFLFFSSASFFRQAYFFLRFSSTKQPARREENDYWQVNHCYQLLIMIMHAKKRSTSWAQLDSSKHTQRQMLPFISQVLRLNQTRWRHLDCAHSLSSSWHLPWVIRWWIPERERLAIDLSF